MTPEISRFVELLKKGFLSKHDIAARLELLYGSSYTMEDLAEIVTFLDWTEFDYVSSVVAYAPVTEEDWAGLRCLSVYKPEDGNIQDGLRFKEQLSEDQRQHYRFVKAWRSIFGTGVVEDSQNPQQ